MKRHYCKFCGKKRNSVEMVQLGCKLLKTKGWICRDHTSTTADIIEILEDGRKPHLVELFSGSGDVSRVGQARGYKTTTIDIESKFEPDICVDITNLRRSELPRSVDVIWASIPCTVFSILSCATHWDKIDLGYRKYYYAPKTKDAVKALRILMSTIDLIKKVNPLFYFIENPRGALRHFPHLSFVPYRKTVSYADYGFDYYKPTDIWTSCGQFQPIECKSAVGRTFESTVVGLNSAFERSLVPAALVDCALDAVDRSLGGVKK